MTEKPAAQFNIARTVARRRRRELTQDEWHRYEVTAEYFASVAQLAVDYWELVRACRDSLLVPSDAAKLAVAEFQRRIEDSHYETFGTRLILPDEHCPDPLDAAIDATDGAHIDLVGPTEA